MSDAVQASGRKRLSPKGVVILLTVAAGSFALLASVQEWLSIAFLPGVSTVESVSVPGQKINPALTLIALAGLAAALVLTIAGPGFRRVIGVLVFLLGGGLVAIAVVTAADPVAGARKQIEEVSGITGDAQDALVDSVAISGWPWVTVAVGAVLAFAGLLVLVLGGRWRTGGRKYESGDGSRRKQQDAGAVGDRISEWDALSDGDDPTVDPESDAPDPEPDPPAADSPRRL